MTLTIGVDVGGTKVAGGVVDDTGTVLVQARRDTPADDVGKTRDVIIELVAELAAGHDIQAVGIGAAGWIDSSRSTVLFAPNLAWRDEPLRAYVSAAVGLPVIVENDGNVAAWAEFRYGAPATPTTRWSCSPSAPAWAAASCSAVIWSGVPTASPPNWATCSPFPTATSAGAAGSAASSSTPAAAPWSGSPGPPPGRSHTGPPPCCSWPTGRPRPITGPMVTAAAKGGDPVSAEAFAQVGRWLGTSLADMAQILDPQILVVGGGVIDAGDLLMGPTRRSFTEALAQRSRLPVAEIRPAELGNSAGVIGAADLARRI